MLMVNFMLFVGVFMFNKKMLTFGLACILFASQPVRSDWKEAAKDNLVVGFFTGCILGAMRDSCDMYFAFKARKDALQKQAECNRFYDEQLMLVALENKDVPASPEFWCMASEMLVTQMQAAEDEKNAVACMKSKALALAFYSCVGSLAGHHLYGLLPERWAHINAPVYYFY